MLKNPREKISFVQSLDLRERSEWLREIPEFPGRDVAVLSPLEIPGRPGLSKIDGQIRLLHDMANIELQAMELCYRTLIEFRELPENFALELFQILQDEARHLQLCLDGLLALKARWGDLPVHMTLWTAVASDDDLLDRLLIVHRYLEGSGLDAGATLIRKLSGVENSPVHAIIETIHREELPHVQFGSRWYHDLCREQGLDPENDFPERMQRIDHQIPRRLERMDHRLRELAGFTAGEISFLEGKIHFWKTVPMPLTK